MHDVEHRLNQLLTVTPKLRNRSVVIALHLQTAGKLRQHQATHPLADLMNVDIAHHVRTSVRCQQAVHQDLQTVCLVDDHLGVLHQVTTLHLHLKQLRCATDAA